MSNLKKWLDGFLPGHIAAVMMALLIMIIASLIMIPLGTYLCTLSWNTLLFVVGFMLCVIFLGGMLAAHLAKVEVKEKIDKSIEDHTSDLTKLIIENVKKRIEELDKIITTANQVVSLTKEEWMLHDDDVSEIEANADAQVDVIAPDLYYEHQEFYRKVIVENLNDTNGPTYRYIIPDDSGNTIMKKDVIQEMISALNKKLIAIDDNRKAEDIVNARFQVKLLKRELFPTSVVYGLAIYRWKDGKEKLLQYLPRRFGTLNVNIPLSDEKLATNTILSIRTHFDYLFNQ